MRRRFRWVRGAMRGRVERWEALACGSTNRLWRGEAAGAGWLLKWYRYPKPGRHPEVEVAEHLAGMAGAPVPGYGGSLEEVLGEGALGALGELGELGELGTTQTVAFVQRWVEGRPAWEWLLEELRGGEVPCERARRWGGEIGRLHGLLAGGQREKGFGVEPWDAGFARGWAERVLGVGEALKEGLGGERPEGLEERVWDDLKRGWLGAESVWRDRAAGLAGVCFRGERSRIHGDLHLGQLLERSEGGAVVVDFEGEPLRPLEERRLRDWPLRDVAGMWRSFAYAAAVSGVGRGVAERLQRAFVAGWQEQMPALGEGWEVALEGLIWEKMIYETLYEVQHRPEWVRVPWGDLAASFCGKTVAP